MAYEATAQLYKRQYDLAKKKAQTDYEQAVSELALQSQQQDRDLESNLEARGILRSGEAMQNRVRIGAAQKSAELATQQSREQALNQAGLTYAQQLAQLQAQGYSGATPAAETKTDSALVAEKLIPGQRVGGADRRMPDGGAVVNGIYIPPGLMFSSGVSAPAPVRPTRGAF